MPDPLSFHQPNRLLNPLALPGTSLASLSTVRLRPHPLVYCPIATRILHIISTSGSRGGGGGDGTEVMTSPKR